MKCTFERVIELRNLYVAWEKVKTVAKDEYIYNGYNIRYYNENIDSLLRAINSELENNVFKFDILHSFDTPKKDGKRVFHINSLKNMIVTQAIINVIGNAFENNFITESYGYRLDLEYESTFVYRDWSVQYNCFCDILDTWHEKYCDKDYTILRFDVKGFFDNVILKDLYSLISNSIGDDRLRNLVKKLLYINVIDVESRTKGLPQGIYSSGFFANIYLNQLDKRIKSKVIGYARYVDDLFILVKDSKKDEIKSLVFKELQSLTLEPNYSKYSEVEISDYISLLNIKNKIKYESIQFIDKQLENMTDKEKESLFSCIEQRLVDVNKNLTENDLEDYSEHINYLLFLNRKLKEYDKNTLHIALKVLKKEAQKYNKLEKIYANLFENDIGNKFLIEDINDYPPYIRLSLGKFLLSIGQYKYSAEFVNKYINAEDYLLNTIGILLAIKAGYNIELVNIVNQLSCNEKRSFLFKYALIACVYEKKDVLADEDIIKFFSRKPDKFLVYIYSFTKEYAFNKLSESQAFECLESIDVFFLIKSLFLWNKSGLYELLLTKYKSEYLFSLFKKEILLNKYLPEDNSKCNIEKLVDIYKYIEPLTDDFSMRIIDELKLHIRDTQNVTGKVFLDLGKAEYAFIDELIYGHIINTVYIGVSDIQYHQVQYKDKNFILEKASKGVFENVADFNNSVQILNRLRDNNLINSFIIKSFEKYNYIFILYEAESHSNLLLNRITNGITLDLDQLKEILYKSREYQAVINAPPLLSSYNIIIENGTVRFLSILSQLKYSFYDSICKNRKNINYNKCIESFGYLCIENFHYGKFLSVTKEGNYERLFELPHMGNLINKIFAKNKEHSYKNINILIEDLDRIIEFEKFINGLGQINKEDFHKLIALDYLGFRMMQYKRYFKNKPGNIETFVESFESIINNFNDYINSKDIFFRKWFIQDLKHLYRFKRSKINAYSFSMLSFLLILYRNSLIYIKNYRNAYDFKYFIEFINYILDILGFAFEMNTQYRLKSEHAVTSEVLVSPSKGIFEETYKKFNYNEELGSYYSTSAIYDNFINMFSNISNKLDKIGENKVKNRKYGKLLVSGLFLSQASKDIDIKYGFFGRKKSTELEKIDKANQLYIKYVNNPQVSFECSGNKISNINIESMAVGSLLKKKKPMGVGKQIKKMFRGLIYLGFIIFWIIIFSWIGYFIYNKVGAVSAGVIVGFIQIIYKDIVSKPLNAIYKLFGI